MTDLNLPTILFYGISLIVVILAFLTVVCRRIFRSAVFLLFALLGIAAIYFMMDMEFVAALQIIVYVGGIVVLIIFSIFLTHQTGQKLPRKLLKRIIPAAILAIAGLSFVIYTLLGTYIPANTTLKVDNSIEQIGRQLLDYQKHGYVLPFEIVSVLLLAALIGSIVIAQRSRKVNE